MLARYRDALGDFLNSLGFRAATTLTAVIAGWTHGLATHVFWCLVASGVACDLARAWPGDPGRRLWPRYLRPVRPLQVVLCTFAVLSVLYFAMPDACWPVVNDLIDRQHGLPAWRFGTFPDMCEVPHGAVIMLTQAILPVLAVMTVAILATSVQIDPELFLRQTWRHIVQDPEIVVASPRKIQLLTIFLGWFMLILFAAIPFVFDPSGSTRPLSPHAAFAYYAKWISLAPVAILLLPHSFLALHAILRTTDTAARPAQDPSSQDGGLGSRGANGSNG